MPAKSKKQAIAARIALAKKKGKRVKVKGASKKMAEGMTRAELQHFIRTHQ